MMTFLQAAEAVATSEETRMGLWKLFSMGGWLMWPLLPSSLLKQIPCPSKQMLYQKYFSLTFLC